MRITVFNTAVDHWQFCHLFSKTRWQCKRMCSCSPCETYIGLDLIHNSKFSFLQQFIVFEILRLFSLKNVQSSLLGFNL